MVRVDRHHESRGDARVVQRREPIGRDGGPRPLIAAWGGVTDVVGAETVLVQHGEDRRAAIAAERPVGGAHDVVAACVTTVMAQHRRVAGHRLYWFGNERECHEPARDISTSYATRS